MKRAPRHKSDTPAGGRSSGKKPGKTAKKGVPVLTRELVEPLIGQALGNLAAIAAVVGVSRQAVSKFVRADPELSALVDAEKERVLDLVERSLVGAAIGGEAWAVCFYLKTQGKDRGYSERHEVTGKDGGPIEVEVAEVVVRTRAEARAILDNLNAAVPADPAPG